ncbi:class I SAM-dependent methyltransferase [Methanohalophilus halophilus]|uniref:tRNA(Phe) (4-demethylwyosine(37)-C(7)) aminocarboxypropyltransferase n=1 Tax=Methanohalophilus halophilus TaxID=2177 RepID=A0A1L3Q4Y3_9EURY|nr:class I SAM-dependent methyltransferase family protein [Methanohalophilus halophilus]APH39952.1 methyltransferase [Methanohalophilus halophilus]RNI07765.1 class I SAM-dependent methyltransferase family protein [Methanohalophilus halophilus]SDW95972.1 methyltransferase [Methanohalophilus halophilus]
MEENFAVMVPARDTEKVRSKLQSRGLLDRNRKLVSRIVAGENFVEIPVTDVVSGYEVKRQEQPQFYRQQMSLKKRLTGKMNPEELEIIPSGWQILGNIIVVTIPEKIMYRGVEIAEELLNMYPSCDTVIRDLGINGSLRQPKRQLVSGNTTETIHKENGCYFKLDVTEVMYSKGNLREKNRMSKLGGGETVVDMFAGIGYFSLPMAVHSQPEQIYSIELNQISFGYLKDNVILNNVQHIVQTLHGNCAEVTPKGVADRVIMGYVGGTADYLPAAIGALSKKGGILHFHEALAENLMFDRPIGQIKKAAKRQGRNVEIMECRSIKKYSPGVWHVVVDARIW